MQRYTLLCQRDLDTHRKKQLGFRVIDNPCRRLPESCKKLRREAGGRPSEIEMLKYVKLCESHREQLNQVKAIAERADVLSDAAKSPEKFEKF